MLAETFKYLYLMYAEEEDILLPINEFIFTTEAHLIPLNISTLNISFNNNEEVSFDQDDGRTDDDISEDISDDDDTIDEILVPLTCEKADTERWSYDYYRRLMLQQCGSLRYGLLRSSRPRKGKDSMQEWKRSVTTSILDFTNDLHIKELSEMGISIKNIGNGQIQLFQSPQNVCMYVCMCVCVYVCMYVCMYACMHVYMYAYMHACMHVCMFACMHVCMYVCMYICICTYVCMYVTYIHMYVCMCIYPFVSMSMYLCACVYVQYSCNM